ncbi:MAG: hypothetical protein Q4D98_03040 [Planctomycetia bacterium]|nr:hypothetical protein [Planctomycetia bacterium]
MSLTKRVWQATVDILAEECSDCDVVRCYDALQNLEDLKGRERPLISVALDGRDTEKVTRTQVQETYHFAAVIQKYIESQEEVGKQAEMDALLPLITKIQDRFCQKTEVISHDEEAPIQLKLISGESSTGEFYDVGYFTTAELFLCVCSIHVIVFRNLN